MNWNLFIKFWENENYIVLILADYTNLFISSSVHQTKLNFNLSIDFQAELDEVIIKFVNHPASTSKLAGRLVEKGRWPSIFMPEIFP